MGGGRGGGGVRRGWQELYSVITMQLQPKQALGEAQTPLASAFLTKQTDFHNLHPLQQMKLAGPVDSPCPPWTKCLHQLSGERLNIPRGD